MNYLTKIITCHKLLALTFTNFCDFVSYSKYSYSFKLLHLLEKLHNRFYFTFPSQYVLCCSGYCMFLVSLLEAGMIDSVWFSHVGCWSFLDIKCPCVSLVCPIRNLLNLMLPTTVVCTLWLFNSWFDVVYFYITIFPLLLPLGDSSPLDGQVISIASFSTFCSSFIFIPMCVWT